VNLASFYTSQTEKFFSASRRRVATASARTHENASTERGGYSSTLFA